MKPIVVANWKANKTIEELKTWSQACKEELEKVTNVEIVLCPTFISLSTMKGILTGSNIKLGAQTVSSKGLGAFTGEVPAELLTGLVSHVIIGHSERRRYFGENSPQVAQKIENLLAVGITPILCISDLSQLDDYLSASSIFRENSQKIIFVYEPPNAISGGGDYRPEDVDSVLRNVKAIRNKLGSDVSVLYGGSVNKEGIKEYLTVSKVNGALIGKASLDPVEFTEISKILASTVI